jgi:hypothetical protein
VNEYASYDDLREYLGQDTSHGDAKLVKDIGEIASRQFDRWCGGRRFYPRSEVRYFDHPKDATRLVVDDDLLEVATSGFTTNNTGTTVSSSDYFLMCGVTYNLTPYDRIVLDTSGNQRVLEYTNTAQQTNAVTGIWGYHEDWSNAWENSQDTVENTPLAASGTSITVNDANGADVYGQKPRFKEQQLLKIEDEYVYMTAVDATTDTLTVVRGVNGTTAAEHAQDVVISIYRPMLNIVQATKDLAKYIYLHKDTADGDVTMFPEAGAVTIPQGVPVTVKWAVEAYSRVSAT